MLCNEYNTYDKYKTYLEWSKYDDFITEAHIGFKSTMELEMLHVYYLHTPQLTTLYVRKK